MCTSENSTPKRSSNSSRVSRGRGVPPVSAALTAWFPPTACSLANELAMLDSPPIDGPRSGARRAVGAEWAFAADFWAESDMCRSVRSRQAGTLLAEELTQSPVDLGLGVGEPCTHKLVV